MDTLGHSTGNTLMTDTMILNKVFQSREIFDYLIVGEHHHPPSDNITSAGSCVYLSRKPVEVTLYANIFSFHQIFSVFQQCAGCARGCSGCMTAACLVPAAGFSIATSNSARDTEGSTRHQSRARYIICYIKSALVPYLILIHTTPAILILPVT